MANTLSSKCLKAILTFKYKNLGDKEILYRKLNHLYICCKHVHSTQRIMKKDIQREMKAWQIHQYGGNDELTFSDTVRVPRIRGPKDVLVKVYAASVNPLDIRMRGGYGKNILNAMRKSAYADAAVSEFPLILGRDFSGQVIEVGREVKKYKVGDEVWGAYFGHLQGTHAEFAVAPSNTISLKPSSISHTEAASIPYVACTTWSALCSVGEMTEKNASCQRILIHGGAGGIGSFAIQLMKSWGAEVTTICSTDAIDLVRSLGADSVIDYQSQDVKKSLKDIEGFDLILNTIPGGDYSLDYLRTWRNSKFVTIVTPLMPNTDKSGMIPGLAKSGVDFWRNVTQGLRYGRSYRWAFYYPNDKALTKIATLVDNGEIKPVIEKVFTMENLPEAYSKVESGHARGKTVIQVVDT